MIDEDLHTIPLLLVLPFKAEAKLDDAAVAAEARRREFVIKAKSKVKLKTGKPFENVSKRRHTKTILSLHNLKAVLQTKVTIFIHNACEAHAKEIFIVNHKISAFMASKYRVVLQKLHTFGDL